MTHITNLRRFPARRPRRTLSWRALAAAVTTVTAAGTIVAGATLGTPAAQAAPGFGTLAGKTVFLDPGHQGGTDGHSLSAQVPDGRGGKKDCQTTGATGVNGVPEHTVNWQVTQLVKAGLESQGARVVLSRPNDTGWGGCVDQRAAAASASGAAVAVSLHADSTSTGTDTAHKGFHMIVPKLPVPDPTVNRVQSTEGRKASDDMRDAFTKAGFTPANYAGVNNGIQERTDIAAVNLTKVPAVFIEMGNLSNPTEAAALSSKDGQLKYATAITNGILGYVKGGSAPAATTPGSTTQGGTSAAPSTAPSGDTSSSDDGIDPAGLGSVIPFVQELIATKNPEVLKGLIAGPGQDVSAQILKAMLSVLYAVFGGKLPVG